MGKYPNTWILASSQLTHPRQIAPNFLTAGAICCPPLNVMAQLTIMTQMIPGNPFDRIRHVDECNFEYWTGRELMPLLGYSSWNKFEGVIDRAKQACSNTGNSVDNHFICFEKVVKRPQGGGSAQVDYKLSRYSCYLIAMNGDPRKLEIASAQSYFAIKTTEAENNQLQTKQPQNHLQVLAATIQQLGAVAENLVELDKKQKELESRTETLEDKMAALNGASNYYTVRGYCSVKKIKMSEAMARRVGICASQICKEKGYKTGSVPDERHGKVNSYPDVVLAEAITHVLKNNA